MHVLVLVLVPPKPGGSVHAEESYQWDQMASTEDITKYRFERMEPILPISLEKWLREASQIFSNPYGHYVLSVNQVFWSAEKKRL